jgi:hypothetical protein
MIAREYSDATSMRIAMRAIRARLRGQTPVVHQRDIINLEPTLRFTPETAVRWQIRYAWPIGPTLTGEPLSPHRSRGIKEIQAEVASEFGYSRQDLLSSRRFIKLCFARQYAMWRCANETMMSVADIGRRFGDRDHTTALHAVKKINKLKQAGLLSDTMEAMRSRRV